MKSLINSKAWAMVVVFMALSLSSAMADGDDFLLSVRNVTQPTASTIEFDLYLLDTDNTQTFEFAALQMGLLLNTSIYGAGTLTVTYSNTGSGLDLTQQFAGSVDVVAPLAGYDGKTLIRLMANSIPPVPPGAGTGTVISSAGNGTFLARFTITGSVSFTPNTRAGLEFCSGTDISPLWPTVLYAYIGGNSTPLAVSAGTDAIVDGDPLLNPILPSTFNVTGTDSYCVGTGGMPVGLDGSEVNTSYALFLDSDSLMAIAGTGAAISFGNQTEGTYSVYAYNPAGRVQMTGQAVITETPVNTVTLTSGVGTNIQEVCINTAITTITYTTTGATGIGTPVNLPAGVIASWAADVITISGTPTVSGTFGYSIPLTGGCGTVSATGTITVNPNMTAGPASSTPTLCIGTALTNITHITTGATGIGTPVNLPAGVIASWAADVITISGTPTVSGTFGYSIPLTGGCGTVSATGTITVIPLPVTSPISGNSTPSCNANGQSYNVSLTSGSDYFWTVPEGASIAGGQGTNSITVDFGATNGNVTVTETNSAGCIGTPVSLAISLQGCGLAANFSGVPEDVCLGGSVVFTNTSTGITGATTYLWDFGSGAIPATASDIGPHTVSYSTSGTKTVSLTITEGASDNETKIDYITVVANNTVAPASATPTLCIDTPLPTITHTTTGATGIGAVSNLPAGVNASWTAGTITINGTPVVSGTFNYSIPLTGGCGSVSATGTINVTALPGVAGSITGPSTFTPGSSGVAYSVNPISAASTYIWTYSGTGVTINGSGTGVTLDFSASATSGTLSVFGRNSCGDGAASTLPLSPSTKTLNLTSVLLEGLYVGGGTMRQAMGESGPQWPAGIADHITVELRNSSSYSTVEFMAADVELTTNGSAIITIPAQHSDSYYITIKHRNHIETVSAAPVPFTDPSITYSFDDQTQAYGNNLKEIVPGSGYFAIYGGDINHDGYVDSGDYPDVINDSFNYLYGYLNTDLNGDGWVDSGDYPMLVNNSYNYVTIIIPY